MIWRLAYVNTGMFFVPGSRIADRGYLRRSISPIPAVWTRKVIVSKGATHA
jgi:hypothetical protein